MWYIQFQFECSIFSCFIRYVTDSAQESKQTDFYSALKCSYHVCLSFESVPHDFKMVLPPAMEIMSSQSPWNYLILCLPGIFKVSHLLSEQVSMEAILPIQYYTIQLFVRLITIVVSYFIKQVLLS